MLRPIPPKERALKRRGFPHIIDSVEKFERAAEDAVLANFLPTSPFITRQTKIVTIGSCFAANISSNLTRRGYSVHPLAIRERLFNPFALQAFLEALNADQRNLAEFSEAWNIPREQLEDTRDVLRSGPLVIVTLGLSFVWFDNQTNTMVFDPTQRDGLTLIVKDPERFEMRPTGVFENFEALSAIIESLRRLHPSTKIVFTLSPIPLSRAVSDYPVVPANAISKATLRCALHEIDNLKFAGVYYFPSYELLRDLAALIDVIWFEDDTLSHIRAEWTAYAVSKFMQHYCVESEAPDLTAVTRVFARS